MNDRIEFVLPFGINGDGETRRKGTMRLATTLDELDIQNSDEVGMNSRYRDILLLSRVIDEIDGIKPVTTEIIEELFEADFLYLQLLYKELNGDRDEIVKTVCPQCGKETAIALPTLYADMSAYKAETR